MAINLSNDDLAAMNRYFEVLLDLYRDGKITRNAARNNCAQLVHQAALDDEGVKIHLASDPAVRWAEMIRQNGAQ
ncbi:MAG: hypothetical protein ACKVP7_14495 [Hyphomicrobiaceae bacterium]